MYENFENLNQERKKLILDACIHEFAEKGYEQASTNSIIKEAGISKGILFHYFKNKRSLFLYIVDYCFQIFIAEYKKHPLTENGDIFQRLIELGVHKLRITQANPEISKIVVGTYVNSPKDVRAEIENKYSHISQEFLLAIFQDIDDSKFREGVDIRKAIQMVMLFMQALGDKYLQDYQGKGQDLLEDVDKLIEEYNAYIEIFKYGMYSPQ